MNYDRKKLTTSVHHFVTDCQYFFVTNQVPFKAILFQPLCTQPKQEKEFSFIITSLSKSLFIIIYPWYIFCTYCIIPYICTLYDYLDDVICTEYILLVTEHDLYLNCEISLHRCKKVMFP
jgi:hypothetical protein